MEVAPVCYSPGTEKKSNHPTIYDTDLSHSDKIGCKATVKRALYAMPLSHVITPPSFSMKSLRVYFPTVLNDS